MAQYSLPTLAWLRFSPPEEGTLQGSHDGDQIALLHVDDAPPPTGYDGPLARA